MPGIIDVTISTTVSSRVTITTISPWVRYRQNATRDAPTINWHLTTDARAACVWLHFGQDRSQTEIAQLGGVSQPAVSKHIRNGLRDLTAGQTAPKPAPLPDRGRVPCDSCPTPHLPCDICVSRVMQTTEWVYRMPRLPHGDDYHPKTNPFGGRGWFGGKRCVSTEEPEALALIQSTQLPLVYNLEHHARHHNGADEGPHLSVNPYTTESHPADFDGDDYECRQTVSGPGGYTGSPEY